MKDRMRDNEIQHIKKREDPTLFFEMWKLAPVADQLMSYKVLIDELEHNRPGWDKKTQRGVRRVLGEMRDILTESGVKGL